MPKIMKGSILVNVEDSLDFVKVQRVGKRNYISDTRDFIDKETLYDYENYIQYRAATDEDILFAQIKRKHQLVLIYNDRVEDLNKELKSLENIIQNSSYLNFDNEQLLKDIYNLLTDLQENLKDFKEKEIL